jgi:hypothetical protein
VVEKDELLRAVWDEVVVGDETLAQNISGPSFLRPVSIVSPRIARAGAAFDW